MYFFLMGRSSGLVQSQNICMQGENLKFASSVKLIQHSFCRTYCREHAVLNMPSYVCSTAHKGSNFV